MRAKSSACFALLLLSGLAPHWACASTEVVAVVSSKSSIPSLSKNQVEDIFLGRSNRFPNGQEAVPINQSEGSSVRNEFYVAVCGKSPAQIKQYWSKIIFTGRGQPPLEASDSAEVKKLLARNPNAISYIDRSELDASVKALVIAP